MRNKFRIFLFLVINIILLFNNLYSQTTYYVDWTNGSDSNDGKSPSTAWKSWYHIQGNTGDTFQPGDSILFKRGEIWRRSDFNALHPGYRDSGEWEPDHLIGTSDNWIIIGAYGIKSGTGMDENRPVIDSDNNTLGIDACYLGYASGNMRYVEFRDIEFTNSVAKTTGGYLFTGYRGANVHHITFKNCFFDATNMNTVQYPENKNETLSFGADYLTVDSCYFYGEPPYNRHAAYTDGKFAKFTHNYVEGFGLSGLKFNGKGCEYGIMSHNLIINCAVGLELGETKYADIFSNIVIITSRASTTGSNPIRLEENYTNNDYIAPRFNKIYNNTIIANGVNEDITFIRHRKSGGSYDIWDIYQDNDIKNNIIYLYNSNSGDYMWWLKDGVTYPAPSDYNIYYSDRDYIWINNTTQYSSLGTWRTSINAPSGFEAHSFTGNPLFVNHSTDSKNPDNYKLSQNSPAIDAGVAVTFNNNITLTDFYDNPVVGGVDIGAIQYQSGTTTQIPNSDFGVDDRTPLTTQTVVFTDVSTSSPTSWQWTFNPTSVTYMDGTSSTSRNPHVRFNSSVQYSVTLIAANSAGSDSETKNNFITASAPVTPPTAAFSVDNKTPTTYQTVTFTDASTNSPTSWQWTFSPTSVTYMDGTSSTSRNPHVRFNSSTIYSVTLKISNSGGSDLETKSNFITATGVKFDIAAFLSGSYENGAMKTNLNSKGFLPKTQPFNVPPWNYGGNEAVTNEFSDDIVDWVLIELRTGLSASTRVSRQAGVIKSDGMISSVNTRGFYFSKIPASNYYIVVHHRNHLSVISRVKIGLNMDSWTLYDFRNSQSKAYGNIPMQDLGNGNFGLYSGDGNSDGVISNDDIQDFWIPQFLNSIDGYQAGDFNLDGSVTASDNNVYWLPNNGKKSNVPN